MTEAIENTVAENTTAATADPIKANHDVYHDIKEMKFGFRKIKDEETGVETKRPNVEVKIPVPSIEGVVQILEAGGKGLELLLQAVESTVSDFIKSKLAEDSTITSENFPYSDVSWDAIANQPESERKGRGIAKEVWEDFGKSYLAIMPGLTGKTIKQVEKQVAILLQKLAPLKSHEDKDKILPLFKDQLTIYANNAQDAENFVEPIEFLLKKADTYLQAEQSADLAKNLGF